MSFPILHKETHSLKISSPEDKKKKIVVNDSILMSWKTKPPRKKHSKSVDYILIPPEKLNVGKNSFKIYLSSNISTWVTMRLENYKGETNNQIFILFKDSHILPLRESPITYLYSVLIILFIYLFLLWRAGEHIYSKILISLLPANILLLSAYIILATLGLRLFVTSCYFWMLQAVSLALACCMVFYNYNKKIMMKNIGKLHLNNCLTYLRSWTIAFWQWLKPRPFSDKCIILFIFLITVRALLLIIHLEIILKQLTNIAYFALYLGVIIKFVTLIIEKD